jgi:hypothetical protein
MKPGHKAEAVLRIIAWFYLAVMLPLCLLVRLFAELTADRRDMLDWHIILCGFIILLGLNNRLYQKRPF